MPRAQYATKNMGLATRRVLNPRGKYDELTPVFTLRTKDPTAKFLKLYVRVVNSIHYMQNEDENKEVMSP